MPFIPKSRLRPPFAARPSHRPPASVFRLWPAWQLALAAFAILVALGTSGIFLHYYVRFSGLIDARLTGDIFDNASGVLSAATEVSVGAPWSPEVVAAHLRKAQYAEG